MRLRGDEHLPWPTLCVVCLPHTFLSRIPSLRKQRLACKYTRRTLTIFEIVLHLAAPATHDMVFPSLISTPEQCMHSLLPALFDTTDRRHEVEPLRTSIHVKSLGFFCWEVRGSRTQLALQVRSAVYVIRSALPKCSFDVSIPFLSLTV